MSAGSPHSNPAEKEDVQLGLESPDVCTKYNFQLSQNMNEVITKDSIFFPI